jgi:hypothetical protein
MEEILASPSFRSSRRYPAMLRYIIEKTLDGQQEKLKERTIGIEVFGRDPTYDTNEDPVVRFSASEIRKRIAQFYHDNGLNRAVEVNLPLGHYVPQFFHTSDQADAVSPTEELLLPERSNEAPSLEKPFPGPSKEGQKRLTFRLIAAGLALLLIAGAAGGALLYRRLHRLNIVTRVWSPLIASPDPVLISAGHPITEPREAIEDPKVTIKNHFLQPEFRVSITTVAAITGIAGFLQSQGKPFWIHDANTNSLADLHGRPVVLVNANDNKWTLLLLKPLRFQFASEGDFSYIKDAKQPGFRGWNVDFTQEFRRQTVDYAIVGRFNSPTTGGPVIIVAGISSNGTEAAGEFIVSPDNLAKLLRSAPPGWNNGNFEAVLKVEVVDGNTGASTVVAENFW